MHAPVVAKPPVISKEHDYGQSFATRRTAMLNMLTSPTMLVGDVDSRHKSYRRRWQHYHACLAEGIRLKEANAYFAESDDMVADEWEVLLQLRTYFAFKDTVLSRVARERLAKVMLDYKENFHRSQRIDQHSTNGNHSIVQFSMYLLLDQEFGNGEKHDIVRKRFIQWVRHQGQYGRDEVNSPHYLERSLLPLLNINDFIVNRELKRWAQMAIDQILIEHAVLSLDNVRGGPWCRAHQGLSQTMREVNDGTQDGLYPVGYLFFGNSPLPKYHFTDETLSYGFVATTSYRPPKVAVELANRLERGSFQYKAHCLSVDSKPSPGPIDWQMYYYITPAYSLGALQNRVLLDNYVTGQTTGDFKNTQVWELTFSDPMKILGPRRELHSFTGSRNANSIIEANNPNTANMQYKNVLFFKGEFLDYNDNLTEGGGESLRDKKGKREFHFWSIPTPDETVFVGITDYPQEKGGILEVGTKNQHGEFVEFQQKITNASSRCRDTGLHTSYVSTQGDRIEYDHGKAKVNGKPWPIDGYP